MKFYLRLNRQNDRFCMHLNKHKPSLFSMHPAQVRLLGCVDSCMQTSLVVSQRVRMHLLITIGIQWAEWPPIRV